MHISNIRKIVAFVAAVLIAASLLAYPAAAHKGHEDDMTDAEMAQMEAGQSGRAVNDMATTMAGPPEVAAPELSPAGQTEKAPQLTGEEILAAKAAENRVKSVDDFLGRLHPMAAHFPIALLLVAALAEIALMVRPTLGLQPIIKFLVAGGSIGAVLTVTLGWVAAGWRISDRSELLGLHRWNGTGIAAASLLAWWFAARGSNRLGLRVMLAILLAALVVQGYLGGEMVLGPNHMGLQ